MLETFSSLRSEGNNSSYYITFFWNKHKMAKIILNRWIFSHQFTFYYYPQFVLSFSWLLQNFYCQFTCGLQLLISQLKTSLYFLYQIWYFYNFVHIQREITTRFFIKMWFSVIEFSLQTSPQLYVIIWTLINLYNHYNNNARTSFL